MRKLGTSLVSMSVLLSACSGMGPQPVLTRTGVVDADVRQGLLTSGPIYNFVQSELAARPYSTVQSSGGRIARARRLPDRPEKIRDMLDSGFAAVYASCDDFFRSSGRDQTRLLVLRDIIVALSSLAGGAIAVIDGNNESGGAGNENLIAGLAFGSTTALTGIDIYTQRYLFGAENIDAVRELTMRALETHRNAVLFPTEQGVTAPTSYDRVLVHLMDNQAKCSPRAISRLSRDAIAAGQLEPDSGVGSDRTTQNQTQDERVLAELGRILDAGAPLTAEQAGALWWLLVAQGALAPTAEEIKNVIAPLLADIPDARNPLAQDGTRKANWSPSTTVIQVLDGLSEPGERAFRLQVSAARAANASEMDSTPEFAAQGLAAPAVEGAAPVRPQFSLGGPARSSGDRRVTVRVAPN